MSTLRTLAAVVVLAAALTGCELPRVGGSTVSFGPGPQPTCGGIKVLVEGALPCDQVAAIALEALREGAPEQLARGVTSVDVMLATCPAGEVPQLIDCAGVQFAQLVTVSFGPAPAGGPIEPSLTVAIEPVTGRVLGISNPLIR